MTDEALGVHGVVDFVDVGAGVAWIEFELQGRRVRWDFAVDDDWLDPSTFENYDRLLIETCSPRRRYANLTDCGQVAFLATFSREERTRFS